MAFTKMARGESGMYLAQYARDNAHERGWFETRVSTEVLAELLIDFEVGPRESVLDWPPLKVYAPVWVHGIWLRVGAEPLDIVKAILSKARDDMNERVMVCTELTLDLGVPRPVRHVAQAYLDLVQQAREKAAANEPPE